MLCSHLASLNQKSFYSFSQRTFLVKKKLRRNGFLVQQKFHLIVPLSGKWPSGWCDLGTSMKTVSPIMLVYCFATAVVLTIWSNVMSISLMKCFYSWNRKALDFTVCRVLENQLNGVLSHGSGLDSSHLEFSYTAGRKYKL